MSVKGEMSSHDLGWIWKALQFYRERGIPGWEHGAPPRQAQRNDLDWGHLCYLMACIAEDYGLQDADCHYHRAFKPALNKKETETIFNMLNSYREDCISGNDTEWNNVIRAMNKLFVTAGLEKIKP